MIIGFTSTGLFTVSQIWLPTYGQQAVGMTMASSIKLLSYYSLGALISVLVLSVLLKKIVRPITVIMIYPIITFISILTILLVKVPIIVSITAFFIGLSTAGIFQLAITIMTDFSGEKRNSDRDRGNSCWIGVYSYAACNGLGVEKREYINHLHI